MKFTYTHISMFVVLASLTQLRCKADNPDSKDLRTKSSTVDLKPDGIAAELGDDSEIDGDDDADPLTPNDLSLTQNDWTNLVVPANMGTQYAFHASSTDFDSVAALNLRYMRISINPLDSTRLDGEITTQVNAMWAKGITPFMILFSTPSTAPTTAASRAQFAAAAKSVAERYRAGKIVFELWNEPNGEHFWNKPDPVSYGNFAADVAIAVRSAGTDHKIIAGSINTLDQPGLTYLESALKARPDLLQNIDGISVHGYDPAGKVPPENRLTAYQKVRALGTKYGRTLPVVLSEWGWTEGGAVAISSYLHAAYSVRLLLVNMYAGLPISILYQLRDGDPTSAVDKYGMKDCSKKDSNNVCLDGNPRGAYWQVQKLTQSLNNFAYRKRLGTGTSDFILVFQNISTGAYRAAVWTTGKTHNITVKQKGKPNLVFTGVSGLPKYVDIAAGKI